MKPVAMRAEKTVLNFQGLQCALLTHSNCIDKRCLPSILKAHQGKFHLLFEK